MPASVKTSYARVLKETVLVRRYTGSGTNRPHFDVRCRAKVTGYAPDQLIGSIVQGDRKVILLAQDIIDAKMALPVTTADKIVVRGKELAIQAVDDSTRRIAGELIAIEIQARG